MSLSRKAKIIVGSALTAVIVTLAVGGYLVYSAYSFLNRVGTFREREIPAELQEAKVFKGADFLAKKDFFKITPQPYSEQLKRAWTIPDEEERQRYLTNETTKSIYGFDDIKLCGAEIVAAGKFGGYIFGADGELKREILFELTERTIKIGWYEQKEYKADLDNLRIIELDDRGSCGFLSHGYREGAIAYNLDGKKIWSFGGETVADVGKMSSDKDEDQRVYVIKAAAGDLDGDGAAEFIVSRKNDGVRAFAQNGGEKWFQPDEFPTADFRLVDVDGDGTKELLEFQGMSSTLRQKETGNVLEKLKIDGWRKDLLVFEDAKKKKSVRAFQIDDNKLSISDLSNKILLEAEAPLSQVKIKPVRYDFPSPSPIPGSDGLVAMPVDGTYTDDSEDVFEPRAVWVRLQKDKPRYLAIVASFVGLSRSNFYVYNEQGNLIYHELLPEEAETIGVAPAANQAEEILIGGKNTIWKFAAK